MSSFKESPESAELNNSLAVHLRRLEAAFLPCTTACAECHLPECTAVGTHSVHACGTDHQSHAICDFCVNELYCHERHACNGKAGHGGKHMCAVKSHACGKPCALAGKATNCNGACAKMPGHAGDCDCECGNHLCGAKCDLPGCEKRCTAPWGGAHDRHHCGVNSCPEVRPPPCVTSHVIALPL